MRNCEMKKCTESSIAGKGNPVEKDVHIGWWQWLAFLQLCSSKVVFPGVASTFPTIFSSSSVVCFIAWIAFRISLPFPFSFSTLPFP